MEYWNSYWNENNKDTCLGNVSDLGMSDFDRFWEMAVSRFSNQVNIQSKLECLDIACGNGVASNQVSRFMPQQAIDFTGIDRANVEFVLDNQKHDVKIFSGEGFHSFFKLPRKFDLVVSNFGIEYLDIKEVEQLLNEYVKSKTTLILNMHDEGSVVSKSSCEEIKAINEFLNDELLENLERELASAFRVELAKQYLIRLKAVNDRNAQRIAGCGISDFVVSEFVACQRDGGSSCNLKAIKEKYVNYAMRLNDQIASAKNSKKLLTLFKKLGIYEETSATIKTSASDELVSRFRVYRC